MEVDCSCLFKPLLDGSSKETMTMIGVNCVSVDADYRMSIELGQRIYCSIVYDSKRN